MVRFVVFLSAVILFSSCSSPKNKNNAETLAQIENLPFENVKIVRVLPTFVSKEYDQDLVWQTLFSELKKIGEVHTPADTSLEKLLEAQKENFSILTLNIGEIESAKSGNPIPVIGISSRLLEKTTLINKKQWMSTVWEKNLYLEVLSEHNLNTKNISQEIENLLNHFSQRYFSVNSQASRPVFYLSHPIQ